ncbi:MAG: alpha-mannosidase, partial [Butyricicoccus sp.]
EKIVQGMDANHQCVHLPELEDGTPARLSIAAYIPRGSAVSHLCADLVSLDERLLKLYYDLYAPLEAAECVGVSSPAAQRILRHLDAAVSELDLTEPYSQSFYDSVERAQRYMTEEFYGKVCHTSDDYVTTTVGHTHIDVAWKWTLAQTREKVVRSFSTVLRMMEQYPEYRFMSSQPQLYQFLKEEEPELFERVKERVREGRWECEGGMWLEPDTNIPSGESLVRQLLYGTRFFEQEFGVRNETLWLPDVFGYSASLPQILKKSGIRHFATAKLGWNQYNVFPYTTFNWVGMDGSEVLVQLITTQNHDESSARTTYNGMLSATQLLGSHRRHAQGDLHDNTLMPYGHGDGGGGPTIEMVEQNRRFARGIPSMPTTRNDSVHDYFRALEKTLENKEVPRWKGELYFECHRGTYTSISEVKKNNRKTEILLKRIEMLGVMDDLSAYPKEELDGMWKTLLLNQFHDVLPGSSIEQVYLDSAEQFGQLRRRGEALLEKQLNRTAGEGSALVLVNTTAFAREEPVLYAGSIPGAVQQNGVSLEVQPVEGGTLIAGAKVPSCGVACLTMTEKPAQKIENPLIVTETHLENEFLSVNVDEFGQLTRIFDKRAGRDVLEPGKAGNVLRAYQDLPSRHDNWNIDVFYKKRANLIVEDCRICVLETGPVRGAIRVEKRFGHSTVRQDIHIWAHSAQLDFVTTLDWHDQHFMVKADFPVDVWTDEMTCDVQFGNIRRSTLKNTSWDLGKFEACSHKWIDLSEPGYGVALLNDCKYGHTLDGNHLELSLLRSGTFPNPNADQGSQTFTYSLLPHMGDWRTAAVDRAAEALNEPVLVRAGREQDAKSLLAVDARNVFVESVKRAEDSDSLIVRLYENHGCRTSATVTFAETFQSVENCDMMENDGRLLARNTDRATLELRPYEIITLKLTR